MTTEDKSVRETVRETKFTSKYIRDLLYADRIPGAYKAGREWRIPADAVDNLKKRKQV